MTPQTIRYLLGLLSLCLVGGLILAFAVIYLTGGPNPPADLNGAFIALGLTVIPNIITVLLSFIAVYFVLERQGIIPSPELRMSLRNLKEFYTSHSRVDWGAIYDEATEIDIGVFYYRHLAQGPLFSKLKDFFARGGKMRLIVADPENENLLGIIGTYFFQGMLAEELASRVRDCTTLYQKAYDESYTVDGRLEIRYFDQLFHYTFTYVDDRLLYLSPYGQFEDTPELLSPVAVVDVRTDAKLLQYWRGQLGQFVRFSHKPGDPRTVPTAKPWRL